MALATLSIDIEAKLAGLEAGMDRASRIAQQNADKINRSFDGLKNLGAGLASSLAAAFSVGAISLFVRSTIDGIDALNDLKDATGSSIENLSALENVAARTGTSTDTLGASLVKLNGVLKEAKAGSEQEKILKAIGLSASELRKLDPAEALQQVAVALSKFADDGNKARIIQDLFGKSVREVAPFLKDLAESGRLNATVTTKQAEEAEKFNKQLFALQKNSKDAARALVSDLVPALNQFFERAQRAGGVFALIKDGFKVDIDLITLQRSADQIQELTSEAIKLQRSLDFSQAKGLEPNRDTVARLAEVRAELLRVQTQAREAGDRIKGLVNQNSPPTSGRRPANEGGGGFIEPKAPDVSGIGAKITKEKLPGPAENKALADAISAINSTDVAKLEALNQKLSELFNLQRETRGDPAVLSAIKATREEIDKITAAGFGPAILDPNEAQKSNFLRSEKEAYSEVLEQVKELDNFAQQAGKNIQDALGDTIARTLKGDFESIGELWKNLLIDMAAQALGAQLGKYLFGDFGTTGKIGGGIGELFKFIGLPSFDVGTDYVPRDMVAKIHKGERILTADQNRNGWGGQGPTLVFSPSYTFASGVSRGEVVAGISSVQENTLAQVRLLLARKGLA